MFAIIFQFVINIFKLSIELIFLCLFGFIYIPFCHNLFINQVLHINVQQISNFNKSC